MERQTQCIGRLVEDMLEVSRIEHGKIQLVKQRLDVAQSVNRAVETVRASLEARGHQIEVALPHKACDLGCGPRPAGAGADEPLAECLQVHGARRPHWGDGGGRRRRCCVADPGQWDRHRSATDRACFRSLLAGRAHARSFAGRNGHWLGAGPEVSGAARRQHERICAGLGSGSEFIVRLPAHLDVPANAPATVKKST